MLTPPPGMPPGAPAGPPPGAPGPMAGPGPMGPMAGMPPGMAAPPMPAPPAGGGDSDTTFATGMLAGLGLRELSQVLGLSRKGQKNQQAGMAPMAGMMPGAADMLNGQLGDIDKLIMLSKLQAQQGPPAGPAGMPGAASGPPPPGPMPGPSPLSSPAPMSALAAAGPPAGPAPMAAPPPGPPIAGGGVVPMLLKQMMGQAGGMV